MAPPGLAAPASGQGGAMLVALVALVASQAVLAVLLFGTEVVDNHPLLPRRWRQQRALEVYRRRLQRLGGAVERARFG